jgi:hypothetical protein
VTAASGGDGGLSAAEVSRDHGASIERTRFAWRRTGLSASAVGLLAVRPAFRPGAGAAAWLLAATAMAAWALLIALAYRRVRSLATTPPRPGRRVVAAYALIAAAFAVLGGLVVML